MIIITNVISGSPAHKAGIKPREKLISINGEQISDVLDYMFYSTAKQLVIRLCGRTVHVKKHEYEDLGLEFESFLMDEQRGCRNKCVFCFIDQLPRGMRETLYFKDDDARLSFLQGNYISLTNLTQRDVERIIKMRLSVNVSVHTTNKALRSQMLGNNSAGEALEHLYRIAREFASVGSAAELNCQLVLCPGINDGSELERSLTDLTAFPAVKSIACVPVGLTKHRKGLTPLRPFDRQTAISALGIISRFPKAYASDELYISAGLELPPYEHYGSFPQYENGVGMLALLAHEFGSASDCEPIPDAPNKSIATGTLAAPFIQRLVPNIRVYAIRNDFFGESVNVAGLVTGRDLIAQLKGLCLGEELLIPETMLRRGDDVFLDGVTVSDVENALGVRVRAVEADGARFYDALRTS